MPAVSPHAGTRPDASLLIDVDELLAAYRRAPEAPVSFGTSGHRGSSLKGTFTDAHVLAISEAICRHRSSAGIDGPLFVARDTHALSEPAFHTAVAVFSAHGLDVRVDAGGGYTPTPALSHAILAHPGSDGIVLTPSHNPPGGRGLQVQPAERRPGRHGRDQGDRGDRQRAAAARRPDRHGRAADHALRLRRRLRRRPPERHRPRRDPPRGVRIGADPLGGASVAYFEAVAVTYGLNLQVVNTEVDPTFRFVPLDLRAAPGQGRGRDRRPGRGARRRRRDDRAARPRQRALPLRRRARGRRALRRRPHGDRDLLRLGLVARCRRRARDAVAAPLLLGDGNEALWLVACAGLLISLLYEPCAGLYRVEQRPQRFLAVTLVNVAVTVVDQRHLDHALRRRRARRSWRAPSPARWSRCWSCSGIAATRCFGPIDRALAGPLLRFGLPFMPSRVALWALNLSNRLLVAWLATSALAGVFVVGANLAQSVALLVTAFQLAWPPFAYGDQGRRRGAPRLPLGAHAVAARRARRGAAARARPRLADRAAGGREATSAGADAMALTALGLAFYGAYYVVGVAVGRVKQTQLNWVVTGIAAITNVVLCLVLIPDYGATGAGAASAIAYFLMAVLMVVRGNRVFPVGYDWPRLAALCALAPALFAIGEPLFAGARRGRRGGTARRRGPVRAAGAQRRSGSAPRSASAVTAACLLGARAGAESSCAASNTRSPARANAAGVGTGARVRTSTNASRTSRPRSRPRAARGTARSARRSCRAARRTSRARSGRAGA